MEGPGLCRWQYRDAGLRFLNIRTIGDGDIDLSKTQFVDPQEAEKKYQHFLLAQYDHVVSSSGTIGRLVTVRCDHLPLMLNTSVIRMRPRSSRMGKWQLKHFLQSECFLTQINSLASGVAQANFGPFHLKQMKLIAPPAELGTEYERIVDPLEELILNLRRRIRVLRQTRDMLLPKLISGEVSVKQCENEAVAQGV
jgi:type I restriction enzyme S subunit